MAFNRMHRGRHKRSSCGRLDGSLFQNKGLKTAKLPCYGVDYATSEQPDIHVLQSEEILRPCENDTAMEYIASESGMVDQASAKGSLTQCFFARATNAARFASD